MHTEKEDPDPLVVDSDPLVASYVWVFCVQRVHERVRVLFFSGMWGSNALAKHLNWSVYICIFYL